MIYLEYGKYYHIYNRSNSPLDLFQSEENNRHFLRLYEKYIWPIADTYSWILMKNHFHFLIRIKNEFEIGSYLPMITVGSKNPAKFQTTGDNLLELQAGNNTLKPNPSHHFSHYFNAYTKYYNTAFHRNGSLFQRTFKRIEATDVNQFRHLVVYIHTNPVHHKFTENYTDYYWSSFKSILSNKPSKICRNQVLELFSDQENFITLHNQKIENELVTDLRLE
jgi:hypothetical protein